MEFYDTFINFNKEQLFEMVLKSEGFEPEAISTAKQIIEDKNWTKELNILLDIEVEKNTETKARLIKEIEVKAEYYKKAVRLKKKNNSLQIRISDIPKFEATLEEHGIEFFRENKNIGVQLDVYPIQIYFFLNEDLEKVDEISKQLGLTVMPYLNIKPFFNFELKWILFAVILTLIFLLYFKNV